MYLNLCRSGFHSYFQIGQIICFIFQLFNLPNLINKALPKILLLHFNGAVAQSAI